MKDGDFKDFVDLVDFDYVQTEQKFLPKLSSYISNFNTLQLEKLLVTCPQIVMVVNENLVQSKFCVQSTTEKNIVDNHSARMIFFRETSTIRPPNQLITARNEVGARLYFHRRL